MFGSKNIVVFGETGSGKSSIINMLLNENVARISDSAVGCTFAFQKYENPTTGDVLFDTVGLSEGSQGTVCSKLALSSLYKLLKSLEDGVCLLVYVMEKGRIKKSLEDNYKLFVDGICLGQVPVIGVLTHCEQEPVMGKWYNENKYVFDTYGFNFKDVVSGCITKGENLNPEIVNIEAINRRYNETQQKLKKSIEANILPEPWKISGGVDHWFVVVVKKIWNWICKLFKWPALATYCSALKDFFTQQLGWGDQEAVEIANEFYEVTKD